MSFIETPIALPEEITGGDVGQWGGEPTNAELREKPKEKSEEEWAEELDKKQALEQKIGAFLRRRGVH